MSSYLSIFDGSDLQSVPIVSKLDYFSYGFTFEVKSYSSSGPQMLVQFVNGNEDSWSGFSAKIHHTPINPICEDWLNTTSAFLTSQNHPTINCSWVITASIGSTISIQFHVFEVKRSICTYVYFF